MKGIQKFCFLLLYLSFCSAELSFAQTITLSGNVEDEFLGTALEDVHLSLHESDSTVIQDSLHSTSYKDRNGKLMAYQYQAAFTPQENKTYIIHAYKEGYGEKWLPFTVTDTDKDLHQLSSTQYEVNAQGRTETWCRSLPHYVMAHLVYHFNKNPKRR